jgi:hypothetical protein
VRRKVSFSMRRHTDESYHESNRVRSVSAFALNDDHYHRIQRVGTCIDSEHIHTYGI